ncbi:UNVERIFIED_CONTAM: hypothetical protein Sradi_6136600 [Sesamum radiatum]|uniref:Reverse transcriptase domain-containing protein n=1 Tax=Sesamum radiatum TaxID=300843 RepID=A0AAW2KNK4_SESRA
MPKLAAQLVMEELRSMTEPAPSVSISDLQQLNLDTTKDKELVLYNPFNALKLDDDEIADDKIKGPKEYNPSKVQNVHVQFIHCKVFMRHYHMHVYVTVMYQANEVRARRDLWHALIDMSDNILDVPWLMLGDFNTVVDMSEVYGHSGDIRVAMEGFRNCIVNTSLITLPMQGCTFTWHNRSDNDRSLWKQLDRMLVNDVWLAQWSNCFYQSLTQRTSDHSPLVLCGNSVNPNYILVFLKATKMEQQMMHQRAKMQWLKGGDQCARIFFRKVNATLLALIPKVQSPTIVANFRLISYCNFLYKAITKILVQQIHPLLDRLASPTQNAFSPGRSISDNILLANELLLDITSNAFPHDVL